jgi:DNA-binding transcriptional LysR family regulator
VIEVTDWNLLPTFLAFAQHLNHATAASQLGISVRTLSRRLSQLEREVGAVLIVRTGSRTALTPTGLWLRDGMTEPMGTIRQRLLDARHYEQAPPLTIAIGTDLPVDWVTRTNEWLGLRGEPAVLRLEASEDALRLLRARELHLALVPGEPDWLPSAVVGHEPTVVVFPADHPAARRRNVQPGDLHDLPVAVSAGADERRRRATIARMHGHPDRPFVVAPSVGSEGRGLVHAARSERAAAITLAHTTEQMDTTGLAVVGLGPEHDVAISLLGRPDTPGALFRSLAEHYLGTPGVPR